VVTSSTAYSSVTDGSEDSTTLSASVTDSSDASVVISTSNSSSSTSTSSSSTSTVGVSDGAAVVGFWVLTVLAVGEVSTVVGLPVVVSTVSTVDDDGAAAVETAEEGVNSAVVDSVAIVVDGFGEVTGVV